MNVCSYFVQIKSLKAFYELNLSTIGKFLIVKTLDINKEIPHPKGQGISSRIGLATE